MLICCGLLTVYCLLSVFPMHLTTVMLILALLLITVIGSFFRLCRSIIVRLLYRFISFWLPMPVGLFNTAGCKKALPDLNTQTARRITNVIV